MPPFEFTKSTYSSGNGECVEVARNVPGTIAVRDSKDVDGAIVQLTPSAWTAFAAHAGRAYRRPVRPR